MLTARVLAGLLAALVVAAPAYADTPPAGGDCNQVDCDVWGNEPGAPGSGGSGGGDGGGGCSWQGQPVPCQDPALGTFNPSDGCYYAKVPAPTPDPHNGAGGWYLRTCYTADGLASSGIPTWSATPPAGPTPEQLAHQALARITLRGADIGIAPDPGTGPGLVGLPVWLWTAVTPHTWGPISASASAGSLTVTITAKAARIVWSLGNGATVTCTRPGTPFAPVRDAGRASPDCGYPGYDRPSRDVAGGRYPITAVTTWRVDWSGGGQSGVITTSRQSRTSIAIDEAQAVTR